MPSLNFAPVQFDQTLEEAFPDIDPGISPYGSRVLVQLRIAKTRSKGGILLTQETQEAIAYNTQTGKMRAIGPLAFCHRTTREPWPEGAWANVGDFVRVPKYGGDKWERPVPGTEDVALFIIFNDLDLIGKIDCDPRDIVTFV